MMVIAQVLAVVTAVAGPVPDAAAPAAPTEAAVAAPRPPPDPSIGERPDGRIDPPPSRWLHITAEILLFPMRGLFILLRYPVGASLRAEDLHHVLEHGLASVSWAKWQRTLRPAFYYSTIYVPELGLRYNDRVTLGPDTRLTATFTTGGGHYIFAGVSMEPSPVHDPVGFTLDAVFDRRADLLYNGLGSHTYSGAPAGRFLANALEVRTGLRARLLPWLNAYVSFGAGLKRFGNGDHVGGDPGVIYVYDPATITGFIPGTTFFRTTGGLIFDTLDNGSRPTRGFWGQITADYTYGIDGDPSSFERLRAQAGVPIKLWASTHVLWLTAATAATWSNHGPVVFSELPTLGGPDDLRGFRLQDFRDYTSFYATAEYRWPLSPWLDAALYTDYGGVFGVNYAGFGARRLQPDVGVGFRLLTTGSYAIRVQLAYGFGEGVNFSFSGSGL